MKKFICNIEFDLAGQCSKQEALLRLAIRIKQIASENVCIADQGFTHLHHVDLKIENMRIEDSEP